MDHPALSDSNQNKLLQTILAISYFCYRGSWPRASHRLSAYLCSLPFTRVSGIDAPDFQGVSSRLR